MAYVKNRHIGEKGRLISDIIEIAKIKKNIKFFSYWMDIEKAFDSLDYKFFIYVLEKYGKKFISWEVLLKNQESCVLNGSTTTEHFLLERGARKGHPISAYLFVLALEILFQPIKSKPEIKRLTIFDHCYLYSAYADDTTFFLQDTISIKHMLDVFLSFFAFF